MANTYVIGGKGTGADASDTNGGAFVTGSATATYANFQGTNGGPCAYQTGDPSTVTDSGQQYGLGFNCIRVTSAVPGDFTNAVVDAWAYCDFGTVYADGRYQVKAVNANYVDLALQYSANDSCSTCNVGGALGTNNSGTIENALAAVDGLLATGDTLLVPTNVAAQRTYTESNTCTIGAASAGQTINIKGVANDGTEITPVREAESAGGIPNGALTTTQFPKINFSVNNKHIVPGAYNEYKNLYITGNDVSALISNIGTGDNVFLQNCILSNDGTGRTVTLNQFCNFVNCDFYCTSETHTLHVVYAEGSCTMFNCRLYSGDTDGGTVDGLLRLYNGSVLYNVFYGLKANVAVIFGSASGNNRLIGNTFYDCTTCFSTPNAAANALLLVANNISVSCTTFADSLYASPQHLAAINNAFSNVGTSFTDADWFGISATSLTYRADITMTDATPFVDAGSLDFNLDGSSATASEAVGASVFKTDLGALSHTPNYSAEADTFFGTGTYGIGGEFTPAMRASDIANCEAGNIKDGVTIDDVTGTYEGGGGGGGLLAHPGMNGGINA